jgi:hypothetical protein
VKKAILIISALVMVLSGVAAVSAYEAHTVNVKCKVENALLLTYANDETDFEFGTLFPEEWVGNHFTIGLSQSAIAERGLEPGDLASIDANIYAEWKEGVGKTANWYGEDPVGSPAAWHTYPGYYNWLGMCLYVKEGTAPNPPGGDPVVGPALAPPPSAQATAFPTYNFDGDVSKTIYVYIDAPVFGSAYNPLTDALACPNGKPSGLSAPTWVITEEYPEDQDPPVPNPLHTPGGLDLGIDLKIQVIAVNRN